ncbi:hypothetical protein ACTA71_009517 [Dictyostelium dimigraforme]
MTLISSISSISSSMTSSKSRFASFGNGTSFGSNSIACGGGCGGNGSGSGSGGIIFGLGLDLTGGARSNGGCGGNGGSGNHDHGHGPHGHGGIGGGSGSNSGSSCVLGFSYMIHKLMIFWYHLANELFYNSFNSQELASFNCYNPNSKYPPVLQPKIPSSAPPSVAIQFPSFPSNLRLIGQVCSRKSSGRKRNVLYKLI